MGQRCVCREVPSGGGEVGGGIAFRQDTVTVSYGGGSHGRNRDGGGFNCSGGDIVIGWMRLPDRIPRGGGAFRLPEDIAIRWVRLPCRISGGGGALGLARRRMVVGLGRLGGLQSDEEDVDELPDVRRLGQLQLKLQLHVYLYNYMHHKWSFVSHAL